MMLLNPLCSTHRVEILSEKKNLMSFGNMRRETMKGSNERVNYICMNGRFVFCPRVGGQKKKDTCNALISFANLCVDVRRARSPKTVVPPLLRAVIKAT